MSRTEDPSGNWSTWEELLLAFAVNRHGTKSWESIAVEIQNRTASSLLLTGHNCRQKYLELQERFTAADEKTDGADDGSEIGDSKKVPWLDELRRLRVAELKREVQRYDVSIGSLQSKVKKLREEREQSLRETDNGEEKPDLEKDRAENERETEKRDMGKRSKGVSGNDSDRENQSFNESNSTDSKDRDRTDEGKRKAEEPFPKPEQEAEAAPGKPDQAASGELPEDKAVGEGSYNGSSDTVPKGAMVSSATKSPAPVPASEAGESAEFRESVAESKGGEEGTKANSDVQSSASLSKKRRRKKAIPGCSSGEEPEPEEVSPVSKRISVKSQPLVGFLEIIRSHKHGSVFERRLESQESSGYNDVIRQHLDLEAVRTKLEEGLYSDRSPEFFRDLLLLFTNAIVFFPKNSLESIAAITLRKIVCEELARSFPKRSPPSKEPAPPPSSSSLPKSAPEPSSSLQPKPVSSGPVIPCGKRSSTSAKSQPVPETLAEEKLDSALPKEPERSSAANLAAVEPRITKKRTRERSSSRGARSNNSRSNGPTAAGTRLSNPIPIPNPSSNASNATAKAAVSNEDSEVKMEKKGANSAVVAKKRSAAANFLNRMKRSLSSSSERTLLDTLKSAINSSSSPGGGQDQKKKGGKGDGRRDSSLRQGSSAKQVVERRSAAGRRSVGRPPKRAATPAQTLSRRAKETVETESKPPPRKRSRR